VNIKRLKALIKQGESEVLEFKNSTGSIHSGMQMVCAFLNSDHGGTVIFGVKDNGQLLGQEVTDKTRKEIAVELNKIEPYTKIDITYVQVINNRQAIVIQVMPGEKAPYTYDGRSFMRNQSTTQRLTQEASWHLFYKKRPTIWEKKLANDCTLASLDKHRIREVVQIAIATKRLHMISTHTSIREILTKLNLMVNDQLTNAAVILFYKGKQEQHFGTRLQLARFYGTDKREFLDNKIFYGNAFDLYEKALEFLGNHLPIAGKIEAGNPYRVETLAIPHTVLREAIANAICHRDYSMHGQSIMLAIYDDRIEIDNPGGLPPGITVAQLKSMHRSVPRNELIANVFYKCEIIEGWGRGTVDMINFCKKAGVPTPKFEDKGNSFSVILRFKEPIRYVGSTINRNQLTRLH
jgi:ATP-dependent DNA helicase RecG